jgi:exopolysaccharide biosynthesis predicted pyruvyltransferase EpsI
MHKPHVVIDTGYGKLRSFVSAWTSESALLQMADGPREALALARELARAKE